MPDNNKTLVLFTTRQLHNDQKDLLKDDYCINHKIKYNLKSFWTQRNPEGFLRNVLKNQDITKEIFLETIKKIGKDGSLYEIELKSIGNRIEEHLNNPDKVEPIHSILQIFKTKSIDVSTLVKHFTEVEIPTENDYQKEIRQVKNTSIFATGNLESGGKNKQDAYNFIRSYFQDVLLITGIKTTEIEHLYLILHGKDLLKKSDENDVELLKEECEKIKIGVSLPVTPKTFVFKHTGTGIFGLLSDFPWTDYRVEDPDELTDYIITRLSALRYKERVYEMMESILIGSFNEYLQSLDTSGRNKNKKLIIKDQNICKEIEWALNTLKNELLNSPIKKYQRKKADIVDAYERKLEKSLKIQQDVNEKFVEIDDIPKLRKSFYYLLSLLEGDIYPDIS